MASRTSLLLSAACFLIPAAVFAQVPSPAAPPEIDQALRARVNEFFQDFIDGKFRQAINLVADDTQDKYFASPKLEMTAFKVNAIDYSDGFTKATVNMTVTRVWKLKAEGFIQDTKVDGPMETAWKIENGKWVFYEKPMGAGQWVTPMGPSSNLSAEGAAAAENRKKINDDTMQAEAQKILGQIAQPAAETGVTPKEVNFALDKPSSAKVTFRNGVPGSVGLSLLGLPTDMPGFSATLEKTTVNSGESAAVELRFDPSAGQPQNRSITIHVIVAPFDMEFPVTVNFGPPPQ
jgi:hypothetical protein